VAAIAETEDQVKAAFLFNFARYVEWPEASFASETSAIRLCILGAGDFEQVLSQTVSGRAVGRRPVEVAAAPGLDAAVDCHLLYIDDGAVAPAAGVAARIGGRAVFTISEQAGFAAEGGIANFILVDSKVRFEINPTAARTAGLKISSSLLRLAKIVGEGAR